MLELRVDMSIDPKTTEERIKPMTKRLLFACFWAIARVQRPSDKVTSRASRRREHTRKCRSRFGSTGPRNQLIAF